MDHFAIPEGAEHIQVPFICHKPFNGAFQDYPERQGWTKEELERDPEFGNRSPREIAAFFQNYLFLGVLAEFHRIAGREFNVTSFVLEHDGNFSLSTAPLPGMLVQWSETVTRSGAGKMGTPLHQIYLLIGYVHKQFINRRFKSFNNYMESSKVLVQEWPVIDLSISALCWTLSKAANKIHGTQNHHNDPGKWALPGALEAKLLNAAWSRAEISIFKESFCIDGLYYFGLLDSPRRHHRCVNCLDSKCTKPRLTDNGYVTQHAKGCAGHCRVWDVSDEAVKMVTKGKTPLVAWKDSQLAVMESDLTEVYVAISHVWSDGLGNPSKNALPTCQVARIQKLVNYLYSRSRTSQKRQHMIFGPRVELGERGPDRQPVGFWLDTLCVPVNDDKARNEAIRQMRTIYEHADRVLVLDSWIQEIPRSSDVLEKSARLYLSTWQTRLWTLQEGVLAHELYIQYKDGPQSLRNLQQDLKKVESSRPEVRYYSTLGVTLVQVPLFALQLTSTPESSPSDLLLMLAFAVGSRTTTRKSDETICLSVLLGIDPSPLLEIPGKKEPGLTKEAKWKWEQQACVKRMQKFFEIAHGFQLDLLFTNLPRLKSEGFGWAPRTFLDTPGLEMPQWFRPVQAHDIRQATVRQNGLGLLVSCPGILFRDAKKDLGHSFTLRQDDKFWCEMDLTPGSDGERHIWDAALEYAIIADRPIGRTESEEHAEAILGILVGEDEEGYRKVRYVCRATSTWLTEGTVELRGHFEGFVLKEPPEDQTIPGTWLEEQNWCLI